nr:GDP-mannose mannosyl hydrolase [Shewanella jiangmenensis]
MIVQNSDGQILLGLRNNRPAKNSWFVPGGRIRKDEQLEEAFGRLVSEELGRALSFKDAIFKGVYQHFYQDNFSTEDFSTHYIVLAYTLVLDIEITDLPVEQHCQYRWWNVDKLLCAETVHHNTKAYFC